MSRQLFIRYLKTQSRTNPFRFYVYAYLRSKDSITGKKGTPYYIGKGCGKRAWEKHGYLQIPPNKDNIVIITYDLTEFGAFALERRYITWYGRKIDQSGCLHNKTIGGEGITAGMSVMKDSSGNSFCVDMGDNRVKTKELVGINKNKSTYRDDDGNTKMVTVEFAKNNGFVGVNKGMMTGIDIYGNYHHISKNDPRIASGEITGMQKGKVSVIDQYGNTSQISKDDPRYVSGELKSVIVGKCNMKDKFGAIYQVSVDDPRIRSGELSGCSKGKINVRDNIGNTFQISKDDPRYVSGELKHVNAGRVAVLDSTGITYRVYKDDPRIGSGELILKSIPRV